MKCDNCEQALPLGCCGIYAHQKGYPIACPLPERKDAAWVVGIAVFRNLSDRCGIGSELDACDYSIQAEIVEAIGGIAIEQCIAQLRSNVR